MKTITVMSPVLKLNKLIRVWNTKRYDIAVIREIGRHDGLVRVQIIMDYLPKPQLNPDFRYVGMADI
tara:strand:+ start:869 stop:1069 length:201 start_codon:yes stop_codon:yes gene_type:complete